MPLYNCAPEIFNTDDRYADASYIKHMLLTFILTINLEY